MTADFVRSMTVWADGREIGSGCRMHLTGEKSMDLRPGLFRLTMYDPSPAAAGALCSAEWLEGRAGNSGLASGRRWDARTGCFSGRRMTEAAFSPGMDLWESACAVSAAPGMKVSDTVRAVLRGSAGAAGAGRSGAGGMGGADAGSTGTGGAEFVLAGYAAEDPVMARGQSFFGRTADALAMLAETAGARAYLSPAGVVFCGKKNREPVLVLTEADLLSEPVAAEGCVVLTAGMAGWPEGAWIRYTWQGMKGEGRLMARAVDADTASGVWRTELLVEREGG